MVDPDNLALGADEVGEHVRQVAGAGADVEDARGRVEEGQERLGGGGVHVRGGDGGGEADGLRGVLVGDGGGIVRAVDLRL